jgi:molybdate transport system substrate-binding protein
MKWLLGVLLLLGWALAQGSTIRVVAASDMQFALTEIASKFERDNPGLRVQLSFGASGAFYTQITQGLPADLFFSADESFPKLLEEKGLVEAGTSRMHAVGRLVLWVRNDLVAQGLDPQKLGPKLLLNPQVTRLALATPVTAPYGRAAVSLLEGVGLMQATRRVAWEEMTAGIPAFYNVSALSRGKPSFTFVYGQNVSQAAQLALTSTGVGIVALSIARSETMEKAGKYWLAPLASHLRLNQTYVILKGQDRPSVRRFYAYADSAEARLVMRRYGFGLPGEKLD